MPADDTQLFRLQRADADTVSIEVRAGGCLDANGYTPVKAKVRNTRAWLRWPAL
jgi:hypothetical protein